MDSTLYPLIKTAVGLTLLLLWIVLEYWPPKAAGSDVSDLKGFLKTVLIALAGHLTGGGA